MKAIVIGGGIGGLATAIALRNAGIDVEVCERAPEVREIGAGLTIWSNTVKSLGLMGIVDEVLAVAGRIETFENRTRSGRLLQRVPVGRLGRRLGHPSIGIHRRDLVLVLADRWGPRDLHLGRECVSMETVPGGVVARFANGAEIEADIGIGADGVFSTVRRSLHGEDGIRYARHVCWRGVLAFDGHDGLPENVSWFGPGQHFGAVAIPGGRFFWFATKNLPEDVPSPPDRVAEVAAAFASWQDPIPALIEGTDGRAIVRNRLYDRPIRWGKGLITLVGDASHPMRPALGQGACQAIDDAVVLGRTIAKDDVERSLRAYERHRTRRVRWVVRNSRWVSGLEQLEARPACLVRDIWMRLTPDRSILPYFATFLRFDP